MKLVGLFLTSFFIGLMLFSEHIVLKIIGRNKISPSYLEILQSGIKKTYKSLRPQLTNIRSQQSTNKKKKYLKRLFGLRLLLDHKLSDTPFVKKPYYLNKNLEYFLVFVFLFIPVIYYLQLFLPEGETQSRFFGIPIKSYGFPDTSIFIWFICQKICILIPLCIWFIVSRTWWKYAILSPIILYTFQIWQTFQEVNIVDESENLKALPFMLIVVITLITLSTFVKYYSKTMDIYEDISDEIDGLLDEFNPEKALLVQKKSEFEKLKATISIEKGEERLKSLLKLRDELLIKINSGN
ncbi:MAG: hypothetical protein MUO53_05170 [Maribacter sp.]|nr:hypothetical protein [Maribacter sp.]